MWAFLLFLCTRFFRLVMFSKTMAVKSESSESPFQIMSSKTMAEKEESSESAFPITSLPEDIIVDIIARVRRCDHPTLSLVSKHLRSIVSSPELYARRSLLGCTEHRLYVLLHLQDYGTSKRCWYLLRNRARSLWLSIPTLPTSGSFIAAGSKIYVFGRDCYSTTAVSIECTSHTVKPLPSMPYMLSGAASMIGGKIYVSGNCDYDGFEVSMVVFNTETQMWEPEIIEPDIKMNPMIRCSVVMADKIYIASYADSLVYNPNESTWGKDEMLDSKKWMVADACVVDDVLYYYDRSENCVRTYDPKKRCWGVVNGLDDLLAKTRDSLRGSETVSYSGKLALFFLKESVAVRGNGLWCAEISLKTRQGGEIWGKVEWCQQVLTIRDRFAFQFPIKSLPVML